MSPLGHTCRCEGCDAPAVLVAAHTMCGAHFNRAPAWRRREIAAARLREDWGALDGLCRLAIEEVDELEAADLRVPA